MKRVFRGRIYLGNTWYFYIILIVFIAIGLLMYTGSVKLAWTKEALSSGVTTERIGLWLTLVSIIALPWMILANLNVGKWYIVDEEGVALIRFGFTFKRFYFKDLSSIIRLSTEEAKELLYQEFARSLIFRRAPMEKNLKSLLSKVPTAWEASTDLNNLIRYSTVAILKIGYGTGYQYPTVEDSKKTFRFITKGPFVLLTTLEDKHILISPSNIDNFLDYSNLLLKNNIKGQEGY
jgi:hypothetical protein